MVIIMKEHTRNFRKLNYKKADKILELKSTILGIKTTVDGIDIRFEMAEENTQISQQELSNLNIREIKN